MVDLAATLVEVVASGLVHLLGSYISQMVREAIPQSELCLTTVLLTTFLAIHKVKPYLALLGLTWPYWALLGLT